MKLWLAIALLACASEPARPPAKLDVKVGAACSNDPLEITGVVEGATRASALGEQVGVERDGRFKLTPRMYRVPVGARHVDVELETADGVVVAKAELPALIPALNPSESTGGAAASLTGPAKSQPVKGKREGTDFVFELQTCPGVAVRTSRGKVVAETVGTKHRVTLTFADAELVRDRVVKLEVGDRTETLTVELGDGLPATVYFRDFPASPITAAPAFTRGAPYAVRLDGDVHPFEGDVRRIAVLLDGTYVETTTGSCAYESLQNGSKSTTSRKHFYFKLAALDVRTGRTLGTKELPVPGICPAKPYGASQFRIPHDELRAWLDKLKR